MIHLVDDYFCILYFRVTIKGYFSIGESNEHSEAVTNSLSLPALVWTKLYKALCDSSMNLAIRSAVSNGVIWVSTGSV